MTSDWSLRDRLKWLSSNKIIETEKRTSPHTTPFPSTEANNSGDRAMPTAFVVGLRPWRRNLKPWLPNRRIYRIGNKSTIASLLLACILCVYRKADVYVWGFKHPPFIDTFCSKFGIRLIRLEDGFVRSVYLGRQGVAPLSICFDETGIYFDPSRPSDLESIIQSYNFEADHALMERAERCLKQFIEQGFSKYNASPERDVLDIYGPKKGKRILVLGQVEGDMSLVKGLTHTIDNNELVRIAVRENPGAHIIYKPHPEVLHRTRTEPPQSDPNDVSDICQILEQDIALADAFATIDHVYTMTSLAGFEALVRGIKVTCLGAPFYAGWGATDDRQPVPRRTALRSPLEIFAAAYILYPRYFDIRSGRKVELEEALELLHRLRSSELRSGGAIAYEGVAEPHGHRRGNVP
ncbi:capsular polysaccharide biosynthesis protein [Ciceribacter sp. RN22]|uniref:capsular polysaccharide export protein, LipB/KpsS family n=1 Tax=Ciceribacter sp. RN22 TaxID=2954932 RepID=UPI00209204B3|nr:capsular polysaccharide biosynthesis protein [Ciceribacter sp. RN22]MCO6179019.1 capsular polysaccharide biosynthesis protein [Ciceribacter sp. RN22]